MLKYLSYLRTGSGSDEIEVQIDGSSAQIDIRRRWMGSGLERYRLAARQHALSSSFGVLVVERVEAAVGENAPFEAVGFDEEEMLLPLVIEYVVVPSSPTYIHPKSQLVPMRSLGFGTWNDSFELLLMVHDFEWRPEKQPWAAICDAIDKKKFAAGSEGAARAQSAREAADAELSRANWERILQGKKD